MTARKGLVQVRNGCYCGSVQNNRTRRSDSAGSVLVEVEEREVGLHQHWMRLESSSSRPDLAAPEHVMESLLVGQQGDRLRCGGGASIRSKPT